MKRKKPRFLIQTWNKKLKLGKKTKRKRRWRAPRGGDSKVRLKEKGYAKMPSIGYGQERKIKGKVKNLIPVRIENVVGLTKMKSGEGAVIARVGRRKRQEIIKRAQEMKIKILNRYKEKNAAV